MDILDETAHSSNFFRQKNYHTPLCIQANYLLNSPALMIEYTNWTAWPVEHGQNLLLFARAQFDLLREERVSRPFLVH